MKVKKLIQALIKEEMDPRRPKDKAFDLAQQLSKLSPEDREKVAMIQQMISKEKMDKDDYGRSISGKDKRTFMEPEDSMPAARARKLAGMEDDPRATFTDDEVEDYYLSADLPELATELGYLNEEEMYGFTVKGASFTYTERAGLFYGVYLYDVPATANVQWREKIRSADEATKWLQSLGIQETVPRRYDENTLDKIVMILKNKGIMADHNDFFDVS